MNDNTYEKPPLGCTPTWVTANKRIKELAEVIERYSENADLYTGLIEMWANEILDQVMLIKKYKEWGK